MLTVHYNLLVLLEGGGEKQQRGSMSWSRI